VAWERSVDQNSDTGREGLEFGKFHAPLIGKKIGAQRASRKSNEHLYKGKLITIKTAKNLNTRVSVTAPVLRRVVMIIAAFQNHEGNFDLYSMTRAQYRHHMVPSKSGQKDNKQGIVSKARFAKYGKFLRKVVL
jgi:hypothetical protein